MERTRSASIETSPVVVAVALNDLEYDGRVRAIASTLARNGSAVTALGVTREATGWQRPLEEVDVRVLPIPRPGRRRAALFRRTAKVAGSARRRLVQRQESLMSPSKARARVERSLILSLRWLRRRLQRRAATISRSPRLRARGEGRVHRRLVREVIRRRPGVIYANGADGLAIAARARRWLRLTGRSPSIVYDADEWTEGRATYSRREGPDDQVELERRWIGTAEAVITVSEPLAHLLQEHHQLRLRPTLVQCAPRVNDHGAREHDLAALAELPGDVRTLVHVGRIEERRGVDDAVSALSLLDGRTHLVLLATSSPKGIRRLVERAQALGVDDRLHFVDPVEPELVVATIRGADIGLLTNHPHGQQHVSMPNKLFQYAQAGLPIVCSDCQAYSRFVTEHGIGEVFPAANPEALAAAVDRALARSEQIRSRLEDPELRHATSWESQEPRLVDVFRSAGALRP